MKYALAAILAIVGAVLLYAGLSAPSRDAEDKQLRDKGRLISDAWALQNDQRAAAQMAYNHMIEDRHLAQTAQITGAVDTSGGCIVIALACVILAMPGKNPTPAPAA